MIEILDHPWFVACQFHPELKSKPFAPHPLFAGFVKAALQHQAQRTAREQHAADASTQSVKAATDAPVAAEVTSSEGPHSDN